MGRRHAVVDPEESPPPYRGTILDAMDLAGMKGSLWDAWRTFWKCVFALPLNPQDEIRLAKHGQRKPPTQPVSEAWEIVGRRGGKSRNAGLVALFLAIRKDYRVYLAPGERAVIPIIAVDKKQARQVMNYLKGLLHLDAFAPYVGRVLTNSVEFRTGVTVEIATASYRTTRGYTVVGIVCDEIAFWRSEESAEPDTEILEALRPGMATIPDAILLALSSPYARKGELYRVQQDSFGKDDPDVFVWNADTLSMHDTPRLQKYVGKKFDTDPIVAASEYGQDGHVVFRSDVESFLTEEAVKAVTKAGRLEIAYDASRRYVAFTDPSGGSQDAWTLAIAHSDAGKAILDVVRETNPPFSPQEVVNEYRRLLRLYGITEVWGDHYGGEFPRELFRKPHVITRSEWEKLPAPLRVLHTEQAGDKFALGGITYRVSERTKSDLYREVLPAINTGAVELLENKRLKAQLCGLERHVARSGQDTIDHAPGGHDDMANAVSGALVLAATSRGVIVNRVAI